tara:strand:+ start:502 stop:972 length:471 start_codon:yes stop_codon:yes gene_type:complete
MKRGKSEDSKFKETNFLSDLIQTGEDKLYCGGCFGPNNTLTIKHHIGLVWSATQTDIFEGKNVELMCKFCSEFRILSLSRNGYRKVMNSNWKNATHFILVKNHKVEGCEQTDPFVLDSCYNELIALDSHIHDINEYIEQSIKWNKERKELLKKQQS